MVRQFASSRSVATPTRVIADANLEGHDAPNAFDPIQEKFAPAFLRQRWRRVLGKPLPPGLSSGLIIRILAWREQILLVGDIDRQTRAVLDVAASGMDPKGAAPTSGPNKRGLRSGTMLVREHGGTLHRVMVLEAGFSWNGRTYKSLSEIARLITGTSWNGYRFFGLLGSTSKKDRDGLGDAK